MNFTSGVLSSLLTDWILPGPIVDLRALCRRYEVPNTLHGDRCSCGLCDMLQQISFVELQRRCGRLQFQGTSKKFCYEF